MHFCYHILYYVHRHYRLLVYYSLRYRPLPPTQAAAVKTGFEHGQIP